MGWYANTKITFKIAAGFCICIVFSIGIGLVSIAQIGKVFEVNHTIINNSVGSLTNLADVKGAIRQYRTIQYRFSITDGESAKQKAIADMQKARDKADKAIQDYETTADGSNEKKMLVIIKTAWAEYVSHEPELIKLGNSGDIKGCATLLNKTTRDIFLTVDNTVSDDIQFNKSQAEDFGKNVQSLRGSNQLIIAIMLVISVIIASVYAFVIGRYIKSNLFALQAGIDKLSMDTLPKLNVAMLSQKDGDLSARVNADLAPIDAGRTDEFGCISLSYNKLLSEMQNAIASFNTSQNTLSNLICEFKSSTNNIEAASRNLLTTAHEFGASSEEINNTMREVSQASDQSARAASEVARGSTEQASAIGESVTMLKQLAESIHGIAEEAASAETAASEATSVASNGASVVEQSVSGMHKIKDTVIQSAHVIHTLNEASDRIGNIVQMIGDIAEQTNLLALNAAIEAARAGEAGRGFAVVADEVRKLAERSGMASQEIASLIQEVQNRTSQAVESMQSGTKQVETGEELAEQAGSSLMRIQEVVGSVTNCIKDICKNADDITKASDAVMKSIMDVAAIVEESSAAAEEMSASAEEVSASVQTVAGTTNHQSGAVSELVNASEGLTRISNDLKILVERFHVNEDYQQGTKFKKAA